MEGISWTSRRTWRLRVSQVGSRRLSPKKTLLSQAGPAPLVGGWGSNSKCAVIIPGEASYHELAGEDKGLDTPHTVPHTPLPAINRGHETLAEDSVSLSGRFLNLRVVSGSVRSEGGLGGMRMPPSL